MNEQYLERGVVVLVLVVVVFQLELVVLFDARTAVVAKTNKHIRARGKRKSAVTNNTTEKLYCTRAWQRGGKGVEIERKTTREEKQGGERESDKERYRQDAPKSPSWCVIDT